MRLDSLGFLTDLMVRRLAGAQVEDRGDHLVVRTPTNPDFYWGNCIVCRGPVAPGDTRRWREWFHDAHRGARHLAVGVDGTDGATAGLPGELGPGATVEVAAVMTARALRPPPRRNDGAEYRPLVTDDDWEQECRLRAEELAETTSVTDGHLQFVRRRVEEARRMSEAGHGESFGAFLDGRLRSVAGIYGKAAGTARYQEVATARAWRRRGLAGTLVWRAGLHGLGPLGARSVVIVAEPSGPAIGLYRSLGFVAVERQVQVTRAPGPAD